MIDPKLNEIPIEKLGDFAERGASYLPSGTEAELLPNGRRGLSINDTIAGDTMLSVGSQGLDTSGVITGAGAGAGMTAVTPAESFSPAPAIIGGGRSSGTTVRGSIPHTGADAESVNRNQAVEVYEVELDESEISDNQIAARAYECWLERGCPDGSPEVDWQRARSELRGRGQVPRTAAATV